MTEREWLALSTTEDLYGELAAVMQPRKLFLLGAAFLTGIEEWVPDAMRTAASVTGEYAQGMTGVNDLLNAWMNAELASGERVCTRETLGLDEGGYGYGCCCCGLGATRGAADRKQVREGVQEAIRDPAWFAARAAWLAREVASHDALAAKRDPIRLRVQQAQYPVAIDILGDPFATPLPAPIPLRTNPTLARLLSVIERQETFDSLTAFAFADALEEAGCDDVALLSHFRQTPTHHRGCWAVERVAGREVIELPLDDAVIWPDDYRDRRRWGGKSVGHSTSQIVSSGAGKPADGAHFRASTGQRPVVLLWVIRICGSERREEPLSPAPPAPAGEYADGPG